MYHILLSHFLFHTHYLHPSPCHLLLHQQQRHNLHLLLLPNHPISQYHNKVPQQTATQWDPHQGVWQPFSAFPPVVQPGHVHPAKASAPVEPSHSTASPSPLTAAHTVPQSPVSTAPSAPDASHTAATTEQISSAALHPPNTPPPSTPAGSVHSDTVNNTQPTHPHTGSTTNTTRLHSSQSCRSAPACKQLV